MATSDLLMSLMNLNGAVAQPQGMPIQPQQNPMTQVQGLPPGTVPGTTAAPDLTANLSPGRQAQSLEDLLFGGIR